MYVASECLYNIYIYIYIYTMQQNDLFVVLIPYISSEFIFYSYHLLSMNTKYQEWLLYDNYLVCMLLVYVHNY